MFGSTCAYACVLRVLYQRHNYAFACVRYVVVKTRPNREFFRVLGLISKVIPLVCFQITVGLGNPGGSGNSQSRNTDFDHVNSPCGFTYKFILN